MIIEYGLTQLLIIGGGDQLKMFDSDLFIPPPAEIPPAEIPSDYNYFILNINKQIGIIFILMFICIVISIWILIIRSQKKSLVDI